MTKGVLAGVAVLLLGLSAEADTLRVVARVANLRAATNTDSKIVTTVSQGASLEVIEAAGSWYKVRMSDGVVGDVHKSVVELTEAASEAAPIPARPAETPSEPKREAAPTAPAAQPRTPQAAMAPRTAAPRGPAARRDHRRFKLLADLAVAPLSLKYTQGLSFEEYNETATVTVEHETKLGIGGNLGLQYAFSDHLGAVLTAGLTTRSASASYTASLPHPLYLTQPRSASGEVTGTSYSEIAVHLDAAYLGEAGSLSYSVFAGPTFFSVSADLAESLPYSQDYPYDTVAVNDVPISAEKKTGLGFNIGANLDYSLGESLSLGGQVRYSRATISLEPEPEAKTEIDAGGLQVSLGVRLRF